MKKPKQEIVSHFPPSGARGSRTHFTIPVYPHVKKFLLKEYPSKANTIKAEEYRLLGKMITLCLKDNIEASNYNDQYRDRLTEEINIIITARQAAMSPRIGKLIRINQHIDALYKEHLLVWIKSLRAEGLAPHTATKLFIKYYDLQEKDQINAYQFWLRYNKNLSALNLI